MTEKEIEQKAEKYFEDNSEEREYGEGYAVECLVGVKQAYKDGYYQCLEDFGNISYASVKKLQKEIEELKNKNKWHDLEKNPKDLPDSARLVIIKNYTVQEGLHIGRYIESSNEWHEQFYNPMVPISNVLKWKGIE